MSDRNGFRPIKCNLHNKIFYGKGTTQVFHKVVFTFCACCWMDHRAECNEHMRRVVFGTPKPAEKAVAA